MSKREIIAYLLAAVIGLGGIIWGQMGDSQDELKKDIQILRTEMKNGFEKVGEKTSSLAVATGKLETSVETLKEIVLDQRWENR